MSMNSLKLLFTSLIFFIVSAVSLHAQYDLTVNAIDSEKNPIAGAEVLLQPGNISSTTDGNGRGVFDHLSPGTYDILVSYGFSFGRKTVTLEENLEVYVQVKGRVEIDEIQVLATRAQESGPLSFTNIDAEEIQSRNYGQDVPFLLKQLPSVNVTSDAGTGIGYTGIRIRGVDPTRINVLMNGVPVNDSESQNVFWVNMPDLLSSVNDIQVQRGVGTSAMGGNSFGGIVSINTNKVHTDPYLRTDFSYGSFNSRRASFSFGTGLGEDGFYADARVSRILSDGYIDRATADLRSLYLAAGKVGDRSSFRVNLIHGEEVTYQAWNGVPAEFLDDPDLRTFNSAGMNRPDKPHPNEVDDYQQTHLQVFYNYTHSANWESGLTLHYTRGKGFFEQYRSNEAFESYLADPVMVGDEEIDRTDLIRRRWLDNDFYGIILNSTYRFSPATSLVFGGGWNHYIGDHFGEVIWARFAGEMENDHRYYENDADKYDFNLFAKIEHQFGDFLAWGDMQLRTVDYRFLGFDQRLENVDQDQTYTFLNPKLGLTWFSSDKTNIYASLAVSNREPNRRDFTESSPDSRPKPERMFNVETGVRTGGDNWNLQSNLYYMGYRDQLVVTGRINDVGAQVRENVSDSYRTGLEVSGSYNIKPNLRLFANATLAYNRIQNYDFFVDKYDENFGFEGQEKLEFDRTPMALSPEQLISGGINYRVFDMSGRMGNLRLDTDLFSQYVSRQYLDNTGNRDNSLDPYHFTDINFVFNFSRENWPDIQFNFMVRNLTDEKYETNGWSYSYYFADDFLIDQGFFPQAGRNFFTGLSIRF